jgi:hypothetical protein
MEIQEFQYNLKEGLPDKSRLAQQAYVCCPHIGWDEARIL